VHPVTCRESTVHPVTAARRSAGRPSCPFAPLLVLRDQLPEAEGIVRPSRPALPDARTSGAAAPDQGQIGRSGRARLRVVQPLESRSER
jgi:hypothetical protein